MNIFLSRYFYNVEGDIKQEAVDNKIETGKSSTGLHGNVNNTTTNSNCNTNNTQFSKGLFNRNVSTLFSDWSVIINCLIIINNR